MPTKQRKREDLIPKKLALLERVSTNDLGKTICHTYYARLWQSKVKRYTLSKLEASNVHKAKEEAFSVWSKYAGDIEEGRDVGTRHRKLHYFIGEFLSTQKQRANDGQITQKRYEVVKHHLVSLTRFYEDENRPTLDELCRRYNSSWNHYRSQDKASKSGKSLSARYRNDEINSHKMFFRWCSGKGYSSSIPTLEQLKVKRTNEPFPQKYYSKLLAVSRKEIQIAHNGRIRWELMNYRTVILLMSGIGCRVLETKNLKWSDIKEQKDGVYVYIHGKDKERTIRMPERIFGHLQDLKKFKESNYENYNAEDYPFVFNRYNSPRASLHYSSDVRRRWMKSAGMENFTDYELVCFRHKFITDALTNGAHSLTVAKYVGTSQTMIEKTYEGLVPASVYDLVFKNTPDEALSRKGTPKWLEAITGDVD
jgi:integrase